jgi:hypothetical protein
VVLTCDGLSEPAGDSEDGGSQPRRRHRATVVAALLRRGPIDQHGAVVGGWMPGPSRVRGVGRRLRFP